MHFVVMEITLVDAFNTWSSGEKVNEDAFIRILWFFSYKSLIWQRISKIIAFLSSCTIILDIIGEENLREYADKIDTSFRTIDIFIILKKIRQSKLNVFFIILIVNLFSFYWLYYLDKILKEVLKSYPQLSWFLLLSVISSCAGFFFMIFFMILKKDFFANISLILFLGNFFRYLFNDSRVTACSNPANTASKSSRLSSDTPYILFYTDTAHVNDKVMW